MKASEELQWRASDLLSRVDQDALIKLCPNIAGSYCELDKTPIIKSYCNVLIILHDRDSDKRWIARIPYEQDDTFVKVMIRPLECAIRKFKTFRRPRMYHFSLASDTNNPVGVHYMLLDFIEGMPMQMWENSVPAPAKRDRVLHQLADIMLELLTIPATEKDGITFHGVPAGTLEGHWVSTTVWLYESVDRGIRRTLSESDTKSAINYLIMRSMVPKYVVPEYDDSPWYIAHCDLHNRNLIVDEEWNIEGVIDWDEAFAVPLQKAATLPKLLEFVPGDHFPDLPANYVTPNLTEDKTRFISILAEKEKQRSGSSPLADLMQGSSERNFFELSHHRMKVHEEFVKQFCSWTTDNIRAASNSLHDFVRANPDFEDVSSVVKVFYELNEQEQKAAYYNYLK